MDKITHKVTPEHIDNLIKSVDYHVINNLLTICCITIENGFQIFGESPSATPSNFDKKLGEEISFEVARNKIFEFEGYHLKKKFYEESK